MTKHNVRCAVLGCQPLAPDNEITRRSPLTSPATCSPVVGIGADKYNALSGVHERQIDHSRQMLATVNEVCTASNTGACARHANENVTEAITVDIVSGCKAWTVFNKCRCPLAPA